MNPCHHKNLLPLLDLLSLANTQANNNTRIQCNDIPSPYPSPGGRGNLRRQFRTFCDGVKLGRDSEGVEYSSCSRVPRIANHLLDTPNLPCNDSLSRTAGLSPPTYHTVGEVIMKQVMFFLGVLVVVLPCASQDSGVLLTPEQVYTFDSMDELTEYPGGFDGAEAGSVAVGEIPADADGLSDGQGATISVASGQVELLLFPTLDVGDNVALMRVSVQSTGPGAAVALAALDGSMDGSIATNIPANSGIFQDAYRRLVLVYETPGTSVIPVIQVANTAGEQQVSIYVDNLEVLLIPRGESMPTDLLYGGEAEKPVIPTPTPVPPTPTPTNTPTPGDFTGETITIPLDLPEGATSLEMVLIPAGTFTMGSPSDERGRHSNEGPQHEVTISQNFYMGKYEVTQAQWEAVMGSNPSYFGGKPNNPVEQVSWNDCQTFIDRLNDMGYGTFRLPTEAEWEYACRAGTTTRFSFGDALECSDTGEVYCELGDQYMWWSGNNAYGDNVYGTKEVGLKLPNPWGLYDMHGNVWEWCSDWYESPYDRGAQVDPIGPQSGSYRVFRGGDWGYDLRYCRSAYRGGHSPGARHYYIGVRLLRSSP